MSNWRRGSWCTTWIVVGALSASASAQSKGVRAISAADMKPYLAFLGSKEFRGRSAPSAELDIASKYLAVEAARIGLKPLMPGGSFFQDVPVEVTTISAAPVVPPRDRPGRRAEARLSLRRSRRTCGRRGEWAAAGGLVFVGSALNGPEPKWDEAAAGDLRGKFAVLLEAPPPGAATTGAQGQSLTAARTRLLREKGALGPITIISRDREAVLAKKGLDFDVASGCASSMSTRSTRRRVRQPRRGRPRRRRRLPAPPAPPFYTVEVRHEAGAALLGMSIDELGRLFDAAGRRTRPVPPKALAGRTVEHRGAASTSGPRRRRTSWRTCRAAIRSSRTSTW